jgi:sulfopyruvate decarboxylase TPP-binding subunit
MTDGWSDLMEMLSGGEMIVRALEDEGVDSDLWLPWRCGAAYLRRPVQGEKVPHILVRHEQAATHAADGYARATGKPGVVLVTSGPGATNAITGIATAYMDSIPMVVLSGQVQSHLIGEDAFQETGHGRHLPADREAQLPRASAPRYPLDHQKGLPHREQPGARARWSSISPRTSRTRSTSSSTTIPSR